MQPKVIEDKVYKGLYRIKYPNGKLSKDLYNYTRVNENIRIYLENLEYTKGKNESSSSL